MNILTFDLEEWYFLKDDIENNHAMFEKYDHYLGEILDVLDERGFKGTFFCLGGLGELFPEVVRKIDGRGHEIGCHSYRHLWLNRMNREEVLEDTRKAIDMLEQCIGKKILSYRAPAFSIGKNNEWAFEILARCGIERDASIYPASRDFGGFPDFGHKTPVFINCEGITLKEYPVCTARLLGKDMAYSGGGYFRFFPLSYVKQQIDKSDYTMTYFHIADLIPEKGGLMNRIEYERYYKEPGTVKARCLRYIKTNIGKKGAYKKLMKLIDSKDFVNMEQADCMINWEEAPSVVL